MELKGNSVHKRLYPNPPKLPVLDLLDLQVNVLNDGMELDG